MPAFPPPFLSPRNSPSPTLHISSHSYPHSLGDTLPQSALRHKPLQIFSRKHAIATHLLLHEQNPQLVLARLLLRQHVRSTVQHRLQRVPRGTRHQTAQHRLHEQTASQTTNRPAPRGIETLQKRLQQGGEKGGLLGCGREKGSGSVSEQNLADNGQIAHFGELRTSRKQKKKRLTRRKGIGTLCR